MASEATDNVQLAVFRLPFLGCHPRKISKTLEKPVRSRWRRALAGSLSSSIFLGHCRGRTPGHQLCDHLDHQGGLSCNSSTSHKETSQAFAFTAALRGKSPSPPINQPINPTSHIRAFSIGLHSLCTPLTLFLFCFPITLLFSFSHKH